jgi:hypothetical protein
MEPMSRDDDGLFGVCEYCGSIVRFRGGLDDICPCCGRYTQAYPKLADFSKSRRIRDKHRS